MAGLSLLGLCTWGWCPPHIVLELFIRDPSQPNAGSAAQCPALARAGPQTRGDSALRPSAIGLARGGGQAVGRGVGVPPLGPRRPAALVQGLLRALHGQVSTGCDIHRVYLVRAAGRWLSAPHWGSGLQGTRCPAGEVGGQAGWELDVGCGHDGGPPGGLHSDRHEGRRPSSWRGGCHGEGAQGGRARAGENRRGGPF